MHHSFSRLNALSSVLSFVLLFYALFVAFLLSPSVLFDAFRVQELPYVAPVVRGLGLLPESFSSLCEPTGSMTIHVQSFTAVIAPAPPTLPPRVAQQLPRYAQEFMLPVVNPLRADFSCFFPNTNVKMVFAYVVCNYSLPSYPHNEHTIYDAILSPQLGYPTTIGVPYGSKYVIRTKKVPTRGPGMPALKESLKGKSMHCQLRYRVMPYAGAAVEGVVKGAEQVVELPPKYTTEQ